MKLAFIILAHDDPDNLLRLIKRVVVEEDLVVIHWDKKNQLDIKACCEAAFDNRILARLRFAHRVAVSWGRWSVVEATLVALEAIESSGEAIDYVVLLSGADYPLRPVRELKAFFAQKSGCEFIECVDPDVRLWVVQGLHHDRFFYHHWFSWRDSPGLFDWSLAIQKKLRLKRKFPCGLKPQLGSQWWALTWETLKHALEMSRRKRVKRFFRTTWVPDEMFFQTIVAAFVPKDKIAPTGVTFYHFSQQGKPLVFYDDHFEFLSRQNYFFARKLSAHAHSLRDLLDSRADQDIVPIRPVSVITKQVDAYQYFVSVQWRGIPGRRVMGRQIDPWYGDLEWNKRPYFVILSYADADLEPLRNALNTLPDVCCYGEIFHATYIDYSLPGYEHPLYPEDKPALRDMKRPNFLCDLIHVNAAQLTGFILRLPCGNEMDKMVIFDRQATPVFILPEDHYMAAGIDGLNWKCAFDNMIMNDYLADARQSGRTFFVARTFGNTLTGQSINNLTAYIRSLHESIAGVSSVRNFSLDKSL